MGDGTSRGTARLRRGDPVVHFRVTTVDGRNVRYANLWQHRNLVLVTLPENDSPPSQAYAAQLAAASAALSDHETECVITREPVDGIGSPGVLIADRWGEIVYVATAADASGLPSVTEILEWVAWLQNRCPECEGEAK
jgi:hypothetical protein